MFFNFIMFRKTIWESTFRDNTRAKKRSHNRVIDENIKKNGGKKKKKKTKKTPIVFIIAQTNKKYKKIKFHCFFS